MTCLAPVPWGTPRKAVGNKRATRIPAICVGTPVLLAPRGPKGSVRPITSKIATLARIAWETIWAVSGFRRCLSRPQEPGQAERCSTPGIVGVITWSWRSSRGTG